MKSSKKTRRLKKKITRSTRAKYALSAARKAYKRGGESKLTRARKLLLGRSGAGFAGRVGLLATAGAGAGVYKIGGNITRSGQNLENSTKSVSKAVQNIERATADIKNSASKMNKGINNVADFLPNMKQKAKNWAKEKAKKGQQQRKKMLGFSFKDNEKVNFMDATTMAVKRLEEALEVTLTQIDDQYEQGLLTDEEADELENNAYDEFEEMIQDLEGEDENSELEYTVYNGALANFSAGSVLGGAIMEHIVACDPEDPEGTIVDLAYELGLVDEEGYELDEEEAITAVLELMSGEAIPDASIIETLADCLDLDEEEVDEIYDLAEGEIEDTYEDEDEEDEEDYYDEEDEGVYYEDDGVVEELENEIEDLEGELDEVGDMAEEAFSRVANMEANFAYAQEQNEIAREFELLERDAYTLVESGQMPPAIFEDNYGSFSNREDQLAAFSQVCSSQGVDASTELYRLQGLNDTYYEMEPSINFSQMSYADSRYDDYEADDALLAQAARNVRNRIANNGFGQPMDFGNHPVAAISSSQIPAQVQGAINPQLNPLVASGVPTMGAYARTF